MVVRNFSAALLSRICRSIATRVAAHKRAARVETIWHTRRVHMQSSSDGSRPRPRRTFSALARLSASLQVTEKKATASLYLGYVTFNFIFFQLTIKKASLIQSKRIKVKKKKMVWSLFSSTFLWPKLIHLTFSKHFFHLLKGTDLFIIFQTQPCLHSPFPFMESSITIRLW